MAAESAQGVIGAALGQQFAEQSVRRSVATGAGKLSITARESSLVRGRVLKYFEPAHPGATNAFASRGLVKPLGNGAYFDLETGKIFGLGTAAVYGERGLVKDLNPVFVEKYAVREFVEDSAGKWLVRNSAPFILDFGFQLAQDWNNPRLPLGYKIGRATVAGGVGLIGGYVVGSIVAPELVIPYLLAGIAFGVLVETPVSNIVNGTLFPERPRDLRPLNVSGN